MKVNVKRISEGGKCEMLDSEKGEEMVQRRGGKQGKGKKCKEMTWKDMYDVICVWKQGSGIHGGGWGEK